MGIQRNLSLLFDLQPSCTREMPFRHDDYIKVLMPQAASCQLLHARPRVNLGLCKQVNLLLRTGLPACPLCSHLWRRHWNSALVTFPTSVPTGQYDWIELFQILNLSQRAGSTVSAGTRSMLQGLAEIDQGLEGEPTIASTVAQGCDACRPGRAFRLIPPRKSNQRNHLQEKSGTSGSGTVGNGQTTGHGGDGAGGRQFR